jgi:hypothetical protein
MGMKWFVIVIVGFLVWAYLSNPLNRGKITQFNRKAWRAGRSHSRPLHPSSKG